MLEVVVKYLYPAFTKVKILAFTVYSSLSRTCRACSHLVHLRPSPGIQNTPQIQSRSADSNHSNGSRHVDSGGTYTCSYIQVET